MDAIKKKMNTIESETKSFSHTIQEKTSQSSSTGAFVNESSWVRTI